MIRLTEQGRNRAVEFIEVNTPLHKWYWSTDSELADDIQDTLSADYKDGEKLILSATNRNTGEPISIIMSWSDYEVIL